jgi:hypothetical protein
MFNNNGIKGTFHINSGLTEYAGKIRLHDISKTYMGIGNELKVAISYF